MPRPRLPHSTVGMDACGGHWAAPSGSRSSAGGGGRKEGKPLLRDVSPAAQRGLVTFAIIFLICIPTSPALGSLLRQPCSVLGQDLPAMFVSTPCCASRHRAATPTVLLNAGEEIKIPTEQLLPSEHRRLYIQKTRRDETQKRSASNC